MVDLGFSGTESVILGNRWDGGHHSTNLNAGTAPVPRRRVRRGRSRCPLKSRNSVWSAKRIPTSIDRGFVA
jgi:hypothetical protein